MSTTLTADGTWVNAKIDAKALDVDLATVVADAQLGVCASDSDYGPTAISLEIESKRPVRPSWAGVIFEPLEKIQEFADAVHAVIDDPRAGSIRVEALELEDPKDARPVIVEIVSNADEFDGIYIGIYDPHGPDGALAVILDADGCTALVEALDACAKYLESLR